MRRPPRSILILVVLIAGLSRSARADTSTGYFYDALGRLTKTTDSTGVSLDYAYDPVGNLLSVTNTTLASVAVFDVTPSAGIVGTQVAIDGRGFSATPADDLVAFSGTPATVVSATATRLEVTVPAGATSGALTVTVGANTATSSTPFEILTGPVVTSLSTPYAVSGTSASLVVTGANLQGATFTFGPSFVPAAITVQSATVAADGTSAQLTVNVSADAVGTFVLVATTASGQSDTFGSAGNTFTALGPANADLDGDGLTNAQEIALGTDPTKADTDGDGLPDGYEVAHGLNPLDPADAALDADGDGISNLDEFLAGTDPRNPDMTPPAVAQVFPADGLADYPTNGRVILRFTEPLQPESLVSGTIQLLQGSESLAGAVRLSNDRLSVTFQPSTSLSAFSTYTLQVDGVRDAAGNPLVGVFQSTFTTGDRTDAVPPTVQRTSLADGQTDVPVNAPVTLVFSKPMDPATLDTGSFALRDTTTSQFVPGMVQVDADNRTVSFVPTQPFAIGRTFVVSLDATRIADAAGNWLGSARLTNFQSFTTGFVADTTAPALVGVSPPDGAVDVPRNPRLELRFSEPLNPLGLQSAVTLQAAGSLVPGSLAMSDGNRLLTFTPSGLLAPAVAHELTISTQVADLAGNRFQGPESVDFTTGTGADTTRPTIAQGNIPDGAADVPVDVVVRVRFSEVMNALTFSPSTFLVTAVPSGGAVPGRVAVAADGLSATFTPATPLEPSSMYQVFVDAFAGTKGMEDLAGNALALPASSFGTLATFTTATGPDTTPPEVVQTSLSGATQVPVNAPLVVQLSEAVDSFSVGPRSVQITAGSVPIAGSATLSADARRLTLVPDTLLAPNTTYGVAVSGLTDLEGNVLVPFTGSFTTGSQTTPDTTPPTVTSVTPTGGATGVPVDAPITVMFSEAVDPTSVDIGSLPVTVDGESGAVAATYAVAGSEVTITPLAPLPGGAGVRVTSNGGVRDLAGNASSLLQEVFDTAATVDTTPPSVVMVTPSDGSTNVAPNTDIVLTFSESLDAATINSTNFALFADGSPVPTTVHRSPDSRTVMLSASLPAGSVIQVAVSGAVQDLSGNSLGDFVSEFGTRPSDRVGPSVTAQRPANGASRVPADTTVLLLSDEALDPASVPGALHVSQNGVAVSGSVQVTTGGRAIEFTPDPPFALGALVQVFLDPTAVDLAGNPAADYQGSFRIVPDPALEKPSVVSDSLASLDGEAPLNPVLEVEFSEALDPTTVDSTTVVLHESTAGGPVVPATVSLRGDRIVRVVPTAALAPNTPYVLDLLNSIRDLQGQTNQPLVIQQTSFNGQTHDVDNSQAVIFSRSFTTGDQTDSTPPTVVGVSPPDGTTEVPLNAPVRVRFSEPINPLTVDATTVLLSDGTGPTVACSLAFGDDDREAVVVPHELLAANQAVDLTIAGVEDRSGNPVATQTTSFTTGAAIDTAAPQVVSATPFNGALDVPVNSPVILKLDRRVDPLTVTPTTVAVDDSTGQPVSGTLSVGAEGREIGFVPDTPFAMSETFGLSGGGVEDLAGNPLTLPTLTFTTASTPDTTPPQLMGVSPPAGLTAVPTNAQVQLRFDEPVQGTSLEGVRLSAGGADVPVAASLSDANRLLTLKPQVLLDGSTVYTLTIDGVADLAGNPLPSTTRTFTTGTAFDFLTPVVAQENVPDGAVDVPVDVVARVEFSDAMNPLTLTPSTFLVENAATGEPVAGSISLAPDGRSATFTPAAPLAPSTAYKIVTNTALGSIQNLVGTNLFNNRAPVRFTTGTGTSAAVPVVVQTSASGVTQVPVNAPFVVQLSAPIDQFSVTSSSVQVRVGGAPVAGTVTPGPTATEVSFVPEAPLAADTTVDFGITGLSDLDGNVMAPFTGTFAAGAGSDTIAPQLVGISPPSGATAVQTDALVQIGFDEAVAATSTENVGLSANGTEVPATRTLRDGNRLLTLAPQALLAGSTVYTLTIRGVTDLAGNALPSATSTFTTGTGPDLVPPTLVQLNVSDGAVDVSVDTVIDATFSEEMNPLTLTPSTFFLEDATTGQPVAGSVVVSSDGLSATFFPAVPLSPSTLYQVVLTSSIEDLEGNALSSPGVAASFTTGAGGGGGPPPS